MRNPNRLNVILCGVLLAGVLTVCVESQRADGQIRSGTRDHTARPQTAFKSGGARAEIVLREIAATLNRIDARLERLEQRTFHSDTIRKRNAK